MEYAEGGIPGKYPESDNAPVEQTAPKNDTNVDKNVTDENTYSERSQEMDAISNVTPMLIDDPPLGYETDKATTVENTDISTSDPINPDPENLDQFDNESQGDVSDPQSPSKDPEDTPMGDTIQDDVQDEETTKEDAAAAIAECEEQDDNDEDIMSRGSPALDSEGTQESQEPESKPEIDDITISEEPLLTDNAVSSELPEVSASISKTEDETNDSESNDASKAADTGESDIAATLPEDISSQDAALSSDAPAAQSVSTAALSAFDKLFMADTNDTSSRPMSTDGPTLTSATSSSHIASNFNDEMDNITDHADRMSIGGASDHDDRTSNADFIDTGGAQNENNLHENLDNDPIEAEQDKNKQLERNSETILPDTDSRLITTLGSKHEILKSSETERQDCVSCGRHVPPIYDCVPGTRSEKEYLCSEPCLDKLRTEISAPVREIRVRAFATQEQQQQQQQPSVVGPMVLTNSVEGGRHCANCRTAIDTVDFFVWEASEFCSQGCFLSYQTALFQNCSYCNIDIPKSYYGKYCVRFGRKINQFCNTHCLAQYKKTWSFCLFCQENMSTEEAVSRRMAVPNSDSFPGYCSLQCKEMVCGLANGGREAYDMCAVCHKTNRIEVEFKRSDGVIEKLCGSPCYVAFKFVNGLSDPDQCITCNKYFTITNTTKQLTLMYEGAEFKFCYEDCRKVFLISNRKIVMCMYCKVKKYNFDMIQHSGDAEYTVCSQNCLQLYQQCYVSKSGSPPPMNGKDLSTILKELTQQTKMPITKLLCTKPLPPPKQRNIGTMCKPNVISKAITCRPREASVGVQTRKSKPIIYLPIPIPVHVPIPVHMYVDPVPMPVPIPICIPIPVFVPTSRKSINGIFKEIAKIKSKVPEDPLEAELLMMADIAAGVKKDESESDSDDAELPPMVKPEQIDTYQPQPQHQVGMDGNHGFGEDVLQMALKMATDFDEPVDLEGAVSATHISAQAGGEDPSRMEMMDHKRKIIRHVKSTRPRADHPALQANLLMGDDKPDANMCLKFTFGVNAWKQWVTTKNADLIKTVRKPKLFKTDPLQLTTDDLNFSLCLFVKEVRKPNGTEYAPDTIYYLCLGIQQYLYENGRIDNLFCDLFYDNFTNSLNEVCVKFASLYNESQYIVTRVEEEHLWESKQLGAHSPLVLLNTLMFFNTKHFALTTVEEHLQLSFSHIMKHWKRNPNLPGARHVLLRFYPPQTGDGRKKRVYEQQENDVNPLRCPVKLYEFYLSKCPESVKTRNDVFYLQPERSCVPDSPVWYSTMALTKEPLEKMLNRVKMVKEINIALLST